ncbi:PREDICTED: uncharacterized protein LOC105571213 [Vollenhovia emeryi]|uniref:uncharacterized protein LOC105571213 n=1 Tax=Vollenhovia emeryi TaxID=411798 RepID=UPI0005F45AB5|nr:PREDICTED: uncharacterized protein LOC105571213 [Vollenhovia emeryi]
MIKGSSTALQQLIDDVQNNLQALKVLSEPTDHWDTVIIYLMSTKLDVFTKREWDKYTLNVKKLTLKEMMEFLTKQRKYLERNTERSTITNSGAETSTTQKGLKQGRQSKGSSSATYVTADTLKCSMCGASHYLYNCEQFTNLSVKDRISKVQQNKLCFNCLKGKHRNVDCTLGPCKKCPLKHNTLLHIEQSTQQGKGTANTSGEETRTTTSSTTMMMKDGEQGEPKVILGTVQVNVFDSRGQPQVGRGLLDNCSQSHFITMRLCKRLWIPLVPIHHNIGGLETWNKVVKYKAQVQIGSQHNGYKASITCFVVSTISEDMPNMTMDISALHIPPNITMADPDFNKSNRVDLLIGGEIFWDHLCYSVSVPTQRIVSDPRKGCYMITTQQLSEQVAKFWETEECPAQPSRRWSQEEQFCESYFEETTTRDRSGRFVVSLPLRNNVLELGESRTTAMKRLCAMERKFSRDSDLKKQYRRFMREYEDLGHMSRISEDKIKELHPVYFLPHHAVTKENSTTTKVRVVFDGSSKTSTGLSINDVQYTGPNLLEEIIYHLVRFRQWRYVLSADITKMYRQIRIHPEQQKLQLILWRENPEDEVQVFQLETLTYGMADAPHLATRCIQIGKDCQRQE